MSDKEKLRKQLKKLRSAFKGEEREKADQAILENFLEAFGGRESFFIYNSFSSEADTKRIISALLTAGKRVYLPLVAGDEILAVPYGQTKKGAFGINEPEGQPFSGDIEVTVIPLLAVNKFLQRIGYGKGYYDRYLRNANTKKVGLGYSFQTAEFDGDEWDVPLDYFVCEKGIYCK